MQSNKTISNDVLNSVLETGRIKDTHKLLLSDGELTNISVEALKIASNLLEYKNRNPKLFVEKMLEIPQDEDGNLFIDKVLSLTKEFLEKKSLSEKEKQIVSNVEIYYKSLSEAEKINIFGLLTLSEALGLTFVDYNEFTELRKLSKR